MIAEIDTSFTHLLYLASGLFIIVVLTKTVAAKYPDSNLSKAVLYGIG